jgi:hypothetical protein
MKPKQDSGWVRLWQENQCAEHYFPGLTLPLFISFTPPSSWSTQCVRLTCPTLDSFFFFFLWDWDLNFWTQGFSLAKQALCCMSHTSSPFCFGYFADGAGGLSICLGWPWTVILPISASQVARLQVGATGAGLQSLYVLIFGSYIWMNSIGEAGDSSLCKALQEWRAGTEGRF